MLESLDHLKKYTLRVIQMSEINLEFKSENEPVDVEPTKAVAEAVTTTLKRAYTMSDLKKEQLTKARARALELRNELNAIKPPKEKTVKIKPPSKMEIEISEIKASKPPEPVEPVEPEPAEPVEVPPEPKLVKVKKQKEAAPIKQQRKTPPLTFSFPVPPPPTPPPVGFQRNCFGFYVLPL
jgi:hypothetical protein